ncbi:hypothetical protein BH23GEM2_BH23GEM2_16390 [soil metagenome]
MTQQEWFTGFGDVSRRIASFMPELIAAAILVLAGWLLGWLLAWLARRGTNALLTRVAQRTSLQKEIERGGTAEHLPAVISGFVFWVVLVFFGAAALETLGLPVVTASLSRVAYYLPNVLAALVIVFAGIIAGKLIGNAVTRAAGSAGMAFGPTVGGTVRGTVILVAFVVALEQVGIKADLLVVIVAVIVGAALAGAGLAFGLGASTAVSNIIASHYVAQSYRIGQTVRVADIEGKIIQTTPTAVFVSGAQGRVMIPARHFSEMASVLLTEE